MLQSSCPILRAGSCRVHYMFLVVVAAKRNLHNLRRERGKDLNDVSQDFGEANENGSITKGSLRAAVPRITCSEIICGDSAATDFPRGARRLAETCNRRNPPSPIASRYPLDPERAALFAGWIRKNSSTDQRLIDPADGVRNRVRRSVKGAV
jgi:hypothetical protein